MRQKINSFPTALQHQLLIQAALSLLSLTLAVVVLILFSITISAPFLIGAALLAASVVRLYHIAVCGHYLELAGVILKVERTPIRQRPKALLLEAGGKALHVVLRNRHIPAQEGHTVTIYIADTTPLYEWHGIHQLHAYLALALEPRQEQAR